MNRHIYQFMFKSCNCNEFCYPFRSFHMISPIVSIWRVMWNAEVNSQCVDLNVNSVAKFQLTVECFGTAACGLQMSVYCCFGVNI